LLEIGGAPGNWALRLTRRGYTGLSIPPSALAVSDLIGDGRAFLQEEPV